MTDKTNPLEPVRVELTPSNFLKRYCCDLCGGHTEKVSTLAEVLAEPLAGFRVCEGCMRRVDEGESLDEMLTRRAARVLEDAQADALVLRSLVGRLSVPRYGEWMRREFACDYQALIASCGDESPVDLLLGGLNGDPRGGWSGCPGFQLYAIASAVEDGHLTLEELQDAAVQAAFPLRDDRQPMPKQAEGRHALEQDRDKDSLLAKYAEREPKRFVQLDAHFAPGDEVLGADDDGDALTGGGTFELMHGASVRVLIEPDCDSAIAVRRLRKLAAWLERNPALMREVSEPVGF
jgi:hypothetical protein